MKQVYCSISSYLPTSEYIVYHNHEQTFLIYLLFGNDSSISSNSGDVIMSATEGGKESPTKVRGDFYITN